MFSLSYPLLLIFVLPREVSGQTQLEIQTQPEPEAPPWIVAYDTVGAFTSKTPPSRSFSNVQIQGCNEIESQYSASPVQKIQVIKGVDHPPIDLYYCKYISTLTVLECIDGRTTTKRHVIEDKKHQRVSKDICDSLSRGEKVTFIRTSSDGRKPLHIHVEAGHTPQEVSAYVLGAANPSGDCVGSEDWGEHENAVVLATSLTLVRNITGSFIHPDTIVLPGGKAFVPERGQYFSEPFGSFFIDPAAIPAAECASYKTVISGDGVKYSAINSTQLLPIATLLTSKNESIMSMVLEKEIVMCGFHMYATSQDGFFVIFYNDSSPPYQTENFKDISELEISEIDTVNNKVNTLYLNLGLALQSDVSTTLRMLCETKEMAMKSHLSVISYNHGLTGGRIGNESGVQIFNHGATSHVVKGVEIMARARTHPHCCQELPVTVVPENDANFTDVFIDARTGVIRPFCTRRVCDGAYEFSYYLEFRAGTRRFHDYFCTYGSPVIEKCRNPPEKIKVLAKPLNLQVFNFANYTNPQIYNESLKKKHQLSNLFQEAGSAIQADVGYKFVDSYPKPFGGQKKKKLPKWVKNRLLAVSNPLTINDVVGTSAGVSAVTIISALFLGLAANYLKKRGAGHLLGLLRTLWTCCSVPTASHEVIVEHQRNPRFDDNIDPEDLNISIRKEPPVCYRDTP